MPFASTPRLRAGLAALLVALTPGWSTADSASLPDLGDSSASVLSAQGERTLGRQVMNQIKSSGGYLDDPEVNAYLESLGHRLLAGDPDASGEFQFFAMNSPEINAFALPGGYVGVNSGLILLTENESELAAVLAHETTHVTQHHIARQMEAQSRANVGMLAGLAAAILAGVAGNGQAAQAAAIGASAGAMQSQLSYTRDFEREADRIGYQRLVRAGFDPRAMAAFFQRLQQATRLQEGNAPGYLRTHPLTFERIAEAQDLALSSPYKQVPDSIEYLLVRALLRSYEGTPEDAIVYLRKQLDTAHGDARNATLYGLAATLLRAGKFSEAMGEIRTLDKAGFSHPMVEALAGQILLQSGQYPAALARYEAALARYPNHMQLVYDYPRTLLKAGNAPAAARFVESQLSRRRDDRSLLEIAAEAQAKIGHQTLSHYHLGELYALQGNLKEAIQQMEIAVRAQDSGEQAQALVEGRLVALRKQLRDERLDRNGVGARGPGNLTDPATAPSTHPENRSLRSFTKP